MTVYGQYLRDLKYSVIQKFRRERERVPWGWATEAPCNIRQEISVCCNQAALYS